MFSHSSHVQIAVSDKFKGKQNRSLLSYDGNLDLVGRQFKGPLRIMARLKIRVISSSDNGHG